MKPTMKEVRESLSFDTFSVKGGIFTVRKEFFYTHGQTTQTYIDKILAIFPRARIVESAEIWKPFRGGANTANSSHFLIRFTFDN